VEKISKSSGSRESRPLMDLPIKSE